MDTQFKDVEFMSAKEKAMVLKQWKTFLKALATHDGSESAPDRYGNSFPAPFKSFSKRLYNHLHLHCGFIAHYNIWGFYQTYFRGDAQDMERFFNHFSPNAPRYTDDFTDINEAMSAIYVNEFQEQLQSKGTDVTDDRFELVKECVKRAETDVDFRKKIVHEFLG